MKGGDVVAYRRRRARGRLRRPVLRRPIRRRRRRGYAKGRRGLKAGIRM